LPGWDFGKIPRPEGNCNCEHHEGEYNSPNEIDLQDKLRPGIFLGMRSHIHLFSFVRMVASGLYKKITKSQIVLQPGDFFVFH
jgi:hypothetical protein